MDNLAHTFVGLAAAKAGLERVSPYATTVCVLAANAPDVDIVAASRGRWFYLENHRGITHSIVGTLALALLIPLAFYAVEKLSARLRRATPRIRLRGLVLASLLASATHPVMDWTNNYGVRPFLPWSGKWYYGDLVFIVDPWLWLVLGGAAFLATAGTRLRTVGWSALALVLTLAILFARADIPVPARVLWLVGVAAFAVARKLDFAARFGRAVPALALAFVPAYWSALSLVHARSLGDAQALARELAAPNGETVARVAAMPSLADPSRWRVVAETDRADYVTQVSLNATHSNATAGDPDSADANRDAATAQPARRFEKLQGADAALVSRLAQSDERARIFLNFARFPLARVVAAPDGSRRAQLFDVRFSEPGADTRRATFAVEIPLPREP